MATQTIGYTDKVFLNENSSIADINKIKDVDMNEIKSVVNNNASETDTNATNITNIQTYSTSETNTGKKWIDGKPIYRKVIEVSNIGAGTKNVNHNISNISNVVSQSGFITNNTEWIEMNSVYRPNSEAGVTFDLGLLANTTQIQITSRTSRSGYSGYVILEYTKTS